MQSVRIKANKTKVTNPILVTDFIYFFELSGEPGKKTFLVYFQLFMKNFETYFFYNYVYVFIQKLQTFLKVFAPPNEA